MPDGMSITFTDREFNAAIDELAADSSRTDEQVLTGQAIQLIRLIVRGTPLARERRGKRTRFRNRGRARAGWWPSWLRLGVFGTPGGVGSKVLANAEGRFRDGRKDLSNPFVEMINEVNYIDKLDRDYNIVGEAAASRFDDMQGEIERRYRQLMRRKSG